MNTKLTKHILTELLCCWLVHSTAQANFYGPAGESYQQSPAPGVKLSPQELQRLVAPEHVEAGDGGGRARPEF